MAVITKRNTPTLRDMLVDLHSRHEARIAIDPVYRQTCALMRAASAPKASETRHYDRDGFCDNPARGY